MDIQRARQAVEKKDEQLDASRRILEAQEDELVVSVVIFLYTQHTVNLGQNTLSQPLVWLNN